MHSAGIDGYISDKSHNNRLHNKVRSLSNELRKLKQDVDKLQEKNRISIDGEKHTYEQAELASQIITNRNSCVTKDGTITMHGGITSIAQPIREFPSVAEMVRSISEKVGDFHIPKPVRFETVYITVARLYMSNKAK